MNKYPGGLNAIISSEKPGRTNWYILLSFSATVLLATYFARRLPNVLQLLLERITDTRFSFNYNHGIAVAITALVFYRFSGTPRRSSLLGDRPVRSMMFPLVLLIVYAAVGISNNQGVDPHLYALAICGFALGYNVLEEEELAWRGFLNDALRPAGYIFRSIAGGILWACWHLLVFRDFQQYGGFPVFLAFCVIFTFILTLALQRTKSILVAAAVHAFVIQVNIATIVVVVGFAAMLIFWPGQHRSDNAGQLV